MKTAPDDLRYVRRLMAERSSIVLDEEKDYLIEARLAPLVRRHGLASLGELIDEMQSGRAAIDEEVVDALATNETWFFRDAHQYEALRVRILPDLIAKRGDHGVRMWSAAASTGQEAYSLALLLRTDFPAARPPAILCTDVSAQALLRAQAGVFTDLEVRRGLPPELLERYFERVDHRWRIDRSVTSMLTFKVHNLAGPAPAVPPIDLVLLRHILIYFDPPTRHLVLNQVARAMRPGGILLLGPSETTCDIGGAFERRSLGSTTYYRLAETERS